MDEDTFIESLVPSALLRGIKFDILTDAEIEKNSAKVIETTDDVTGPDLGMPNHAWKCSTCEGHDTKNCDGHFGTIKLPATIFHPYFIPEILQILNKVCPGCKSVRHDRETKGSGTLMEKWTSAYHLPMSCKYCFPNSSEWYPAMKFKSSKDLSGKKITVEVNENLPKKFESNNPHKILPEDYWDFIPKDPREEKWNVIPRKITLRPYQVFSLLKELDPKFIEKFVSRRNSLFLSSIPVTPNCNRVMETMHVFADGPRLTFDERTRAYRRLVDFGKQVKEFGPFTPLDADIPYRTSNRVMDCLNVSKLSTEGSSSTASVSCKSGLKWIKEVLLGKRTDYAFRMTVVGDPKIGLGEIGIPLDISENLQISEYVNSRNLDMLNAWCNLRLLQDGQYYGKSKGHLFSMHHTDKLQIGNTLYRPLVDGDLVLINRPPSVHQHSLIAFTVKTLPVKSVISLNPLCCAPLLGDFDGDCLHGYVPQSINSRVELQELVSLNRQLLNGQNGRNLLPLSQDSLTAAYLMTNSDVFLNRFQMQQLEMFCPRELQCPAILKAPLLKSPLWTGKQLFSMLLPESFDFFPASDTVLIRKGNILYSSGESIWLRNSGDNVFSSLIKHCPSKAIDFLFSAQELLCEWISMRGLTVSLSDIYLSSGLHSRMKMINEVNSGLQEAEDTCYIKQLMACNNVENLLRYGNQDQLYVKVPKAGHTFDRNSDAVVLSQVAISTFKEFSYDLQNVIQRYASKDNSMLAMINAGSKGNSMKLLQQSACLGLQHSTDLLPFQMPDKLSCAHWNQQKISNLHRTTHDNDCAERHVSYAVVWNSFLDGLNPLECFFHALSSRGNFFSENADLPGTLTRKLMFYMRDLHVAYDGTVRSAYGNQVVQFSYGIAEDICDLDDKSHEFLGERTLESDGPGGQPVGGWSACAISEAAYGALDQPISMTEKSPLLNLKKVFDCGRKENSEDQSVSLFLSEKLRRWTYGFEYAAIEVKNHLERVLLSDVVTTVMIICSFTEPDVSGTEFSPWVSHFHLCKERMKMRKLTVQSIMDELSRKYNCAKEKMNLPNLRILSRICSSGDEQDEHSEPLCITVTPEDSEESVFLLETVRDLLIPALLGTVIKGFPAIRKVDILWDDHPKAFKFHNCCSRKLFLKVFMSENCQRGKFWSAVQDACIPIMDLIDWEHSRPDNLYDVFRAFGIDAAWKHFLGGLKSATSDVGRTMHQEHLLILADCLSVTGEFHGLNAKGLKYQRDQTSISTPFSQACFSNPGNCFIKAAKERVADDLCGTLDAVAWGKEAPVGTGGSFDILYSGKGQKLGGPVGIYETLQSHTISQDDLELKQPHSHDELSKNWRTRSVCECDDTKSGHVNARCVLKSAPRRLDSWLVDMCVSLRDILHKYPMNDYLNEEDKSLLMKALIFHPQRNAKIGTGPQEIKIGYSPSHPESRCFMLVRNDGTLVDFSYRKCVMGAVKQYSPELVPIFKKRLFKRS